MLIQHKELSLQLKKGLLAIYILAGPDEYAIEAENHLIKKTFQEAYQAERKLFHVLSESDWDSISNEMHHYDLFTEKTIVDIRYEKKSMDKTGKKILTSYLDNPNVDKLIILRCQNIAAKQLSWLSSHSKACLISAYPPSQSMMRQWLVQQLQRKQYQYPSSLIEFILNHTRSNMLACAQTIKKIHLSYGEGSALDEREIQAQLLDESTFQVYDLSDAMLQGNKREVLKIVNYLLDSKGEISLVLWLISKEIRLLLALKFELKQGLSFQQACDKHKIWKQKAKGYQQAHKKLSEQLLNRLLQKACAADMAFKSSASAQAEQLIVDILMSFCEGRPLCIL